MTGLFWTAVAVLWIGAGMVISGGSLLGLVAILGGAFALAVLGYAMRATQPVAYRIEADALVIERRRGSETRIAGAVAPFDGNARLGMRLGSGGLYGYRGRFRLGGGGWSRAFVTDVRRSTLIRVGGYPVVLSPVDPAALVREVRGA